MNNLNETQEKKPLEAVKPLVLLNSPIRDISEDILGFQTHVDTLQAAINANAQMIAITSPFGTGKSSVTELLGAQKGNQKVINVSMWSHLCKKMVMILATKQQSFIVVSFIK